MIFKERNEILEFRESSPEKKYYKSIFKNFFVNLLLKYYKYKYKRYVVGSEKWHIIQDKLSARPSVGIASKKRILFYSETLPECGEGLYVHPYVAIYFPQNVFLGENVFFNRGVFLTARAPIQIGNNVLVGPYTVINSGNHIYSQKEIAINLQGHDIKDIIIDDDVWIGAQCTILKGVHIGKGAVVAAGSVVTKDVAPFTVVAGIPASQIKERWY